MSDHVPACQICGQTLEQASDTVSKKCGGHCWSCLDGIEADAVHGRSLREMPQDRANGTRHLESGDSEFVRRGLAALRRSEAAGDMIPADQVVRRLQSKLDRAHAERKASKP